MTKEGNDAVEKALKGQRIEAVATFLSAGRSVEVLGSSSEHTDKAISTISGIVAREKIDVKKKHLPLMKTQSWSTYCEKIKTKTGVLIRKRDPSELWILGLRSNVTKAIGKLQYYLENNAETEEEIECPSGDIKEYLLQCRKLELEKCDVKVRDGEDRLSLYISGKEEGLKQAGDLIAKLIKDMVVSSIEFKQPGVKKFSASGDLDGYMKKITDREKCFIRVEKNVFSVRHDLDTGGSGAARSPYATSSGSNALLTAHGHKISWKPGDIAKEQVKKYIFFFFFLFHFFTNGSIYIE